MNRLYLTLLCLGTTLWLHGSPTPVRAQTLDLPTTALQVGMHLIQAEVASDERSRALGLMHRTGLKPNQGMLFIFPEAGRHCFWMRNTPLPLTIAFLDADGTIAHLADMQPQTETSHCPPRAVRYALEMPQGWFKKRGVQVGQTMMHPTLFGRTPRAAEPGRP